MPASQSRRAKNVPNAPKLREWRQLRRNLHCGHQRGFERYVYSDTPERTAMNLKSKRLSTRSPCHTGSSTVCTIGDATLATPPTIFQAIERRVVLKASDPAEAIFIDGHERVAIDLTG